MNSAQVVHEAARAHERCVGWKMNSWMLLPELRALMLPPQSSETQLIPDVPILIKAEKYRSVRTQGKFIEL